MPEAKRVCIYVYCICILYIYIYVFLIRLRVLEGLEGSGRLYKFLVCFCASWRVYKAPGGFYSVFGKQIRVSRAWCTIVVHSGCRNIHSMHGMSWCCTMRCMMPPGLGMHHGRIPAATALI